MSIQDLGREVARARKAANLDQQSVADAAAISVSRLDDLEAGKSAPQAWELTAIANTVGLDRSVVVTLSDPGAVLSLLWCPVVGDALRAARAHRSVGEVAGTAGISPVTLQRWERADCRPRTSLLPLLDALHLTAGELLSLAIWPPQHPPRLRTGLAAKLFQYRQDNELSQYQMAALLGVCQETYQPWEFGRTRPSKGNQAKIAELLSMGADEMVDALVPIQVDTWGLGAGPTMLVEARLAAGLTRNAAARRIGVGATMITNWEAGKTKPRPRNVPAVAETYGLDPVEMVCTLSGHTAHGPSFGAWLQDRIMAVGQTCDQVAGKIVSKHNKSNTTIHPNAVKLWCADRKRPAQKYWLALEKAVGLEPGAVGKRLACEPEIDPGPLARALRHQRTTLKMPRSKVAVMIGTSEGQIQSWEEVGCRPSAKHHAAIATFLNRSVGEVQALVAA